MASTRHTVRLLCILGGCVASEVVFRLTQRQANGPAASHPSMAPFYLAMIVSEWALAWAVWRGLRRQGIGLADLIGGDWRSGKNVAIDAGLAVALWLTWIAIVIGASWLVLKTGGAGQGGARSVSNFLPVGNVERVLWVLVSLTAGFCEELVFRGYFQRQFHALTGRFGWAVLLQGVVFGLLHLYQGIQSCLIIILFGVLFGLVARWRKSLRPGMLAHAWSDVFFGLIVPIVAK